MKLAGWSHNLRASMLMLGAVILTVATLLLMLTWQHGFRQSTSNLDQANKSFYLGRMYEEGMGVDKDYTRAFNFYMSAAELGYAPAQKALGDLYWAGTGVDQDYEQAEKWYRKAIDQGYTPAQFSLGTMYEYGEGVPQDFVQAYMWYSLASETQWRDDLASRMKPEQISEARKLADAWQSARTKK